MKLRYSLCQKTLPKESKNCDSECKNYFKSLENGGREMKLPATANLSCSSVIGST